MEKKTSFCYLHVGSWQDTFFLLNSPSFAISGVNNDFFNSAMNNKERLDKDGNTHIHTKHEKKALKKWCNGISTNTKLKIETKE